jgi:hypothetical protein
MLQSVNSWQKVETIVKGRRAGGGEEVNKEEKIILYECIQIYYI